MHDKNNYETKLIELEQRETKLKNLENDLNNY